MADLLQQIGAGFWDTLLEMAPYLLFGFFVAGLLSVLIRPETVERHLGRGRFLPVLKASLFGVPLPLCSCGVIPVAASLRQHGANRGATTAFLISTPQTGVDSIFVTYSLLGVVFAVFRPVAAFVSGVIGGTAVALLEKDGEAPTSASRPADGGCCCEGGHNKRSWGQGMYHGFVTLPRDIAGPLFIGLIIAGLIAALVPKEYFMGGLGSGLGAKFILMLVGIPVYVCATASVPVAAALIGVGISPGAALVFLMTGPATNAATVTTLWKVMGHRAAGIYLFVVAATALASGILLDQIYVAKSVTTLPHTHTMLPTPVKVLLALALVVVLVAARYNLWARFRRAGNSSRVHEGEKATS